MAGHRRTTATQPDTTPATPAVLVVHSARAARDELTGAVRQDQRYSVAALARLLHVPDSTIYRAATTGALPANRFYLRGRLHVLVDGAAAITWATRPTSSPTKVTR